MNQEQIERNFTFIVEQQAKFFADIEELKALGKRTDARLSRAIRLGIAEARQEREKRRQVEEQLTAKLDILLDAQIRYEEYAQTRHQHLDEKLDRLAQAQIQTAGSLDAFQSQLGQALTAMAQAITATNQRVDAFTNGQPVVMPETK